MLFMKVEMISTQNSSMPLLLFCRFTGSIWQVREPSPLKIFCCSIGVLRLFDAFKVISGAVSLSTRFPGKPPRQFTSIVSAHSFASN